MAVPRELEEAMRLVDVVDESICTRFPHGTLINIAWERLKANLHEWQLQVAMPDPVDAFLRARELEHDFHNIVALFEEAGFDFDEQKAR